MIENIDFSLVDWSRMQFAVTALYHWLFVPLTLGLGFIIAIMETIYVKSGDPEWKRITKFWMKLFGINFAIGIATGIILEFEFGTNWSNYSWFVGDIFGAPLAIEGIMAFFLESTFVVVMFFGWNKVGKKFHLASTWLTAIGANLSALWILVANGWMQDPVGMHFNPETARNEMLNFWDILFSPTAVTKFIHTCASAYILAAIFVMGISAWFMLKKKEPVFARKSMLIASIFGLMGALVTLGTGDLSSNNVAQKQPMKLAAMEGLYYGQEGAGLVLFGFASPKKQYDDIKTNKDAIHLKIEIPKMLSMLGKRDPNAFIPGVKDLVEGNPKYNIMSTAEKIERGKTAINTLREFKEAKKAKDTAKTMLFANIFEDKGFQDTYFKYFGYGFLDNPRSVIPNIPLTFYAFHIMVPLGFYFFILIIGVLILLLTNKLEKFRWLLTLTLFTIPLAYLASECGWIVAELGRQPWAIQDMLPTMAAVSKINVTMVQTTLALFVIFFTVLFIAEIRIILTQVKSGPAKITDGK
jgi:cytochrome bd ubiquinol oxidase subunit I